jgi:hypothetical protein
MADLETIKERIRDIAGRRRNVTFDEIQWVVNQLGQFYNVGMRPARHGALFKVENQRFMVSSHNPGSKQVKSYSVDGFINAMVELGLCEE